MWGGGGGLLEYRSALLASHGYASLALEYVNPGELESADMEFKYFEVCVYSYFKIKRLYGSFCLEGGPSQCLKSPQTAFNIVRLHPLVSPDRVGFFGLCLGSIMTNYLAAESTAIKASATRKTSGRTFSPDREENREVLTVNRVFCSSLVVAFVSAASTFIHAGRLSRKSTRRSPCR